MPRTAKKCYIVWWYSSRGQKSWDEKVLTKKQAEAKRDKVKKESGVRAYIRRVF